MYLNVHCHAIFMSDLHSNVIDFMNLTCFAWKKAGDGLVFLPLLNLLGD